MKERINKIISFLQSPTGLLVTTIFIVAILFLYFLFTPYTSQKQTEVTNTTNATETKPFMYPTTNPLLITSMLSFTKEDASVAVILTTGNQAISGVQLAIAFDPKILTQVHITPGNFLPNPVILENSVDTTKGIIHYTAALSPRNKQQKQGGGIVAVIYYKQPSTPTLLSFLPETKVTSLGVNTSVLKTALPIQLP